MHKSQQEILKLAEKNNLAKMSLREMGEKTGIGTNPQLVRHHLHQLIKNGFLIIDKKSGHMKLTNGRETSQTSSTLLYIPIMGQANCGQALSFADNEIEGYLPVLSSLIKKSIKKPYALRAMGDSMNTAKISTLDPQLKLAGIDEGDYVIVDSETRTATNNEYVVAVIEGLANIKKLKQDEYGVRLVSESSQSYPPISISSDEQENFVHGKVIAVVKS